MTTALVILAALIIFGAAVVIIVGLTEQRDRAYRTVWTLRFKVTDLTASNKRLKVDNTRLTQDYAAVVARLAEVLDEHASCPAPVSMPDRARIVRIPLQRQGGRS